jgi:rhodanese-related sulfurtransferase
MSIKTVYLDVRDPYEFASGHVKGALNYPPAELMQDLPDKLASLPIETELVVYCASGGRAEMAIEFLRRHGFYKTFNGINQEFVEMHFL